MKRPLGLVAVTGASGLMGCRIVPALEANCATVRKLMRRHPAQQQNAPCVIGDLAEGAALDRLVTGADSLVHLAGIAHTRLRTREEYARAVEVNVTGTHQLLIAARKAGVRQVVLMSSAHVYTGQRGTNLHEDSPTDVRSTYGALKLRMEQDARAMASEDFHITILRPCLVYGQGVRHNLQALLHAVRGGYYLHPGGGDTVRSFVSVETVAAAVVHVLRCCPPGGTFNLADQRPVSLCAWVDGLAELMGVRPPWKLPVNLLRTLACAGSGASKLGLPAPLTLESLRRLTAPFTLDVGALAATGFIWPLESKRVLQEMVDFEFGKTRRTHSSGRGQSPMGVA